MTGGRGSGKSFSAQTILTNKCIAEDTGVLFTRYTMVSAHKSIIPEFQEKIELLGGQSLVDITKTDVKFYNGSIMSFTGIKTSSGDQTANLKSLKGYNIWVIDEAEELTDESMFDKIDLSFRDKTRQNLIVIILNPSTKEHWIYKRFFEQMGVQEGFNGEKGGVCYIHTTYLDNIKHLSDSFLQRVEQIRKNNPKKYKHVILGGWLDKLDGVVFENWEYGEFNPNNLQTSFGMDFGFSVDPDTLTEVAIDKARKIIYVKECIYQNGLKTDDLAKMVKHYANDKLIISEVDPRLVEDLKHRGCNIRQHKKGKIEVGVQKMLEYKIIVEPNSANIAKELNHYIYSDKASKLYVDDNNHAIDGIRYNVEHHLDNPNEGNYAIW